MSTTHQSNVLRRKVLVTGASGLLSVAAMEKFVAAGWEAGRRLTAQARTTQRSRHRAIAALAFI
jgi:NAD(P)-dependent dehydrogenase (short-subunit alcohol dehydrogenase family)